MFLKNKLEVIKLFDKRNEIINNLFKQEFELLLKRYEAISEEADSLIDKIFKCIDEDTRKHLVEERNLLSEIIDEAMELTLNEVLYIIWYRINIDEYSCFKEMLEDYNILSRVGYAEIAGRYLIYKEGFQIKEYMYTYLEKNLDDSYFVDRFFDKDTLIDFWIGSTSKYEAIEEIIQNKTLEDIVNQKAKFAFTNDIGVDYKIIEIENLEE